MTETGRSNGGNRAHVLALSEESANVRSVARGWAAGEVPLEDYRSIRAMTLEAMLDRAGAAESDPTPVTADEDLDDSDATAIGEHAIGEFARDGDLEREGLGAGSARGGGDPQRPLLIGGAVLIAIAAVLFVWALI